MMRDRLRPLAVVGSLAVAAVFGLSFWTAFDTSAEPRPDPPPFTEPSVRSDLTRPAPPSGPAADPKATELARDAQLEAAHAAIRELELELYGEPRAWDDSVAPTHRPEAVAQTLDRVIEACGIEFPMLGLECDEPPCLAVFDVTGHPEAHDALVGCPEWSEPWGRWVGQATRTVVCDDGSARHLLVITPGTERVVEDEMGMPVRDEPTAEGMADLQNRSKRFHARVENVAPKVCG